MPLIIAYLLLANVCFSADAAPGIKPRSRLEFSELSKREIDERLLRINEFAHSDNCELSFKLVFQNGKSVAAGRITDIARGNTRHVSIFVENNEKTSITFSRSAADSVVVSENGASKTFDNENILTPLIKDSGCCSFNMCMPFLNWPDRSYSSKTKKKGRLAHKIIITPPSEIAKASGIHKVEVYIDKNFDAILEASALDLEGNSLATFTVLDFKKFHNIWSIKTAILSTAAASSTIIFTNIKI